MQRYIASGPATTRAQSVARSLWLGAVLSSALVLGVSGAAFAFPAPSSPAAALSPALTSVLAGSATPDANAEGGGADNAADAGANAATVTTSATPGTTESSTDGGTESTGAGDEGTQGENSGTAGGEGSQNPQVTVTQPAPVSAPGENPLWTWTRFLVGIVVVFMLLWVLARWYRKSALGEYQGPGLRVVSRLPLSRSSQVVLIEIGGRMFLVGAGEDAVNPIAEIYETDELDTELEAGTRSGAGLSGAGLNGAGLSGAGLSGGAGSGANGVGSAAAGAMGVRNAQGLRQARSLAGATTVRRPFEQVLAKFAPTNGPRGPVSSEEFLARQLGSAEAAGVAGGVAGGAGTGNGTNGNGGTGTATTGTVAIGKDGSARRGQAVVTESQMEDIAAQIAAEYGLSEPGNPAAAGKKGQS